MPERRLATILLVDDEQDIIITVKHALKQFGFDVDAFTEPRAALEGYRPGKYDRIIADIRMPGMTGFQFAREIWDSDPDAKFCFLSAFEIHDAEVRKVLPSLKRYCFITKPLLPSELVNHLNGHLQ